MLALCSHHLFVAIVIFMSVETSATVSSLGVSPYIIPKLTILGIIFRAVVAALLALLVATEVHKVTSIKGDNVLLVHKQGRVPTGMSVKSHTRGIPTLQG
jgi:hypothetical protein